MENGKNNGTLAKLAGMRQRFMADFQAEAAQFRINVQGLREKYLNEIVDLTMTDAKIAEVQRVLDFFKPTRESVAVIPPSGPATIVTAPRSASVEGMVAIGQSGDPTKFPMKENRRPTYGSCPNCNRAILEPQAQFCSQCAYPLDEV